ncbi:PAQR family membrane homeostasis protein TrhA [Maribacter halichondriae]|uniref:PAQR family membrane homeostasis protein TrhA n=1 Tax=Maribacter halichondriae TaxID=2980554 RepID=UPI00235A0B38|nr:hemolysin III family protein [Maribacter sp. Hal144]
MSQASKYHSEERLNALSHGLGALLAVVGMMLLLSKNNHKSEFATFGVVVYGLALITMLLVSAGYHATSKAILKKRFRILDHINIYFLIAGTYTPVALITLIDGNGWTIFFVVWIIAALGTVFKLFYTGKYEFISLLLYVAMGWLIVLDFGNLMEHTSYLGIQLLFLGGAFYTLGIFFYAWERIPYNHFIWHIFVLGGAMSHWFFIYLDVV